MVLNIVDFNQYHCYPELLELAYYFDNFIVDVFKGLFVVDWAINRIQTISHLVQIKYSVKLLSQYSHYYSTYIQNKLEYQYITFKMTLSLTCC